MIRHHLSFALAKFRKAPFTTAANVLTLALGLACFIAAYGVASYWRSGDQHHPGADRIVFLASKVSDATTSPTTTAPRAALDLREEFPELEAVARIWPAGEFAVSNGDAKSFLNVAAADPETLSMFDFTFLEGDAESALRTPNDIILSESAARRFFGDSPALGQRLIMNDDVERVVTGVIAPLRQPSFMGQGPDAAIEFDVLAAMPDFANAVSAAGDDWWRIGVLTFARLPETSPLATFAARLEAFSERRIPPGPNGLTLTLEAAPLGELNTRLASGRFLTGAAGASIDRLLIGLGALILVIACVNYANLAAAQTLAASRTVGLRKVLGAGRAQIMAQYWLEAGLQIVAAALLAVGAVALASPLIRTFVGADAVRFLTDGPQGAGLLAAVALLASLGSAVYPALTTARVRAADALVRGQAPKGSRAASRILVGAQFLSASFLLIIVTVMQLQEGELRRLALEGRDDPVALLGDINQAGVDFETLSARLAAYPQIRSATTLDWAPWSRGGRFDGFGVSLEPPSVLTWEKTVGLDYFATLQQDVTAGRAFDADRDTPASLRADDSSAEESIVLDERAARRMGFARPQDAVGERIYWIVNGAPQRVMRVVGVVATDNWRLESGGVDGVIYHLGAPDEPGRWLPALRIAPDDVPGAVAAITRVWDELSPNVPLRIDFYDDLFEQSLNALNRMKVTFIGLSLSAFAISTFGLLGVAVHAAARRRHEIGVRKTLGASTLGVIRLLLVDFSKPVLAANLLAWPLAYLFAQAYLAQYAERVALTPAPFALSMAITLAIAWAAVIGEVLKAASVRPAEVLRHA